MKTLYRKKPLAVAIVVAMVALAANAMAEEEAGETGNKEEKVQLETLKISDQRRTVTTENTDSYTTESMSSATKLDLSIRETPQSVSVVTQSQMEDFSLNNVNDLLEFATGITVERVETDRTYYTSRGFDVTNFQVDGVGAPFDYGNAHGDIDTALYDHVEITRGANGLTTGIGEPSATVNFIRKRPTRETQASLTNGIGSWGDVRVEADVSGALADKVRGRLIAVRESRESYLDNYALDKEILYGVIEADVGEDTVLTVGHSTQVSNADSPMWGALPLTYTDGTHTDYDRSTSTSTDWSYWDSKVTDTFIELEHELRNRWKLKGNYTQSKKDEDSYLFYVYGTPDPVTELGLNGWASEYDLDTKTRQADIYATGPFSLGGRKHELIVGLTWGDLKLKDTSLYDYTTGNGFPVLGDLNYWIGDTPLPVFADGLTGSDNTDKQTGVYATARFNTSDDLTIITGARFSKWSSQGSNYGVDQTSDDDVLLPYLGVTYDIDADLSAYASYTETFNYQLESDINGKRLDPKTGINYEAGIKGEFFNNSLNASLAVFQTRQDNVAEYAGTIGPDAYYRAADGIRSRGVEFEASGEMTDDLRATLGITKLEIEDGDGNDAKLYIPRTTLRAAATYRVPAAERLSLGASVNWQDDIKSGSSTAVQAAYALVDLMANYDLTDKISLTFNARNITDEKYLTSLYWPQAYYGAPRNYYLTLRWEY